MLRRRSTLAALATIVIALSGAALAGPAAAGGPTSVLLVAPDKGYATALYTGSPDYEALVRLVDAFGAGSGSTTPPKGAGSEGGASGTVDDSGSGVTLTWLMHDVSVWRVDRVYMDNAGGPWISTQSNKDGSDIWAKPPTWRVAPAGKELAELFLRLGLDSRSPAGTGVDQTASTGERAPAAAAAAVNSPPAEEETGLPGPAGLVWGPAGLLLGIALTLAISQVLAVRRGTATAEREDENAGGEPDPEPGRPMAEVLTSYPAKG